MISNTIFVIESFCQMDDSLNSFLYVAFLRPLKNCNLQALYKLDDVQTHNQTVLFILRKDALYQFVCIYFKSAMCFVAIPFLDAATLFCLDVTAAKELFIISIVFRIIFDNCFKIWTIGHLLVLFWSIAIIAFSRFLSRVRYQMSSQMHCLQQFRAKVVSIMQTFYRLCLQV